MQDHKNKAVKKKNVYVAAEKIPSEERALKNRQLLFVQKAAKNCSGVVRKNQESNGVKESIQLF